MKSLLISALVLSLTGCNIHPEQMAGTVTGKFVKSSDGYSSRYLVFAYKGMDVDKNAFNAVDIGDCVRITVLNVRADVVERLDPSDPACTYVVERIK